MDCSEMTSLVINISSKGVCFGFKTVDHLQQALSGAVQRHTVLSNNLANANTPGFKRSDVHITSSFADEYRSKLQRPGALRTHPKHLNFRRSAGVNWRVVQDNTTAMRNDGNNVDPDREMALVAENQLYYQALVEAVSRKLSSLRSAITEGRG